MMFHAFCKNSMDIGAGIFVHSAIPQLPGKRVNPRVDSSSQDDIVTHQEGMDSGIHLSVFFLHFLSFLNTTLPLKIQHFTGDSLASFLVPQVPCFLSYFGF